jgi:hypothetical protein
MSTEVTTFVERYQSRQALADDIDDYVDLWHGGGTGKPLREFLGFTPGEYALWAEKPDSLELIFHARRTGCRIDDVRTVAQARRLSAGCLRTEAADELTEWLKQTGRISD